MNQITKSSFTLNFYFGIFLFLIQIFIRRLIFIPSSYLVPYLYFFKYKLSSISVFYICYIVYSIFITSDFKSLIIYSLLFLFNTFVYNNIVNNSNLVWFKLKQFQILIRYSLLSATFLSLLFFLLNINILANNIYLTNFNPFNALNLNAYIYIIYFYAFLSLSLKKVKDFIFALTLLLISDSRTGLIMFGFALIQLIFNYKVVTRKLKIKKSLFIGLTVFTSIVFSLIIITSLDQRFINNLQNSSKFLKTDFKSFNETTQLLKKAKLTEKSSSESSELHRLCITSQNIKHIGKTFPFGTGIGLGSYQNSLEKNNLLCAVAKNEPIRAHNFYISYLAEMGIFFFPLLLFFLSHLRFTKSRFIIIGLLLSLLGQEYITMPYIWMILALSNKLDQKSFLND